jgi:hypothetical protein
MPQTIPPPRDGANPSPESVARPRPWPMGRRLMLPIITAVFALVPAGGALACTSTPTPPAPSCDKSYSCAPTPGPSTPDSTPTATEATTSVPDATSVTPEPTPVDECEGDAETCDVVTDNPSFTG